MTELLDGRPLAATIRTAVTEKAAALRAAGTVPALAIVVATDEDATASYVRSIEKAAGTCGFDASVHKLPTGSGADAVVECAQQLSSDPTVHGVLIQTPLPEGVVLAEVAQHIAPAKDIDGANPLSLGRLSNGLPSFAPATATAVVELLAAHDIALSGRHVAVIGRSAVVGRPLAQLLLAADATVTICHSKTRDLAAVTRSAEVIVAAAGRAHLVGRAHVAEGAVVIDVGTNVDGDGHLVGDVDGAAVDGIAGARSPVPGGVGPVTTAVLLRNVVTAARRAAGAPW